MITKKLINISFLLFSMSILHGANNEILQELDVAIEQTNKAKVRDLLLYGNFTLQELQAAHAKALAIYDQKNTFLAQTVEVLLSPVRIASFIYALKYIGRSYDFFKQARWWSAKKPFVIFTPINNEWLIDIRKKALAEVEKQPVESSWLNSKVEKESEAAKQSKIDNIKNEIAKLEREQKDSTNVYEKKIEEENALIRHNVISWNLSSAKWAIAGLACAGIFYILTNVRSALKDARAIVAAIEAKMHQKGN